MFKKINTICLSIVIIVVHSFLNGCVLTAVYHNYKVPVEIEMWVMDPDWFLSEVYIYFQSCLYSSCIITYIM